MSESAQAGQRALEAAAADDDRCPRAPDAGGQRLSAALRLRGELGATRRIQQESFRALRELRSGHEEVWALLAELGVEGSGRMPSRQSGRLPTNMSAGNYGTVSESTAGSYTSSWCTRYFPYMYSFTNSHSAYVSKNAYRENHHKWRKWLEGTVNQQTSQDSPVKAAVRWCPRTRTGLTRCARRLVHSTFFDTLVGLVIIANSFAIGVEIQWDLDERGEGDMRLFEGLESGFITFYAAEVVLRLLSDGLQSLRSRWFQMDIVLVSMGIFSQWILRPLLSSVAVDAIGQVLIVRTLRLLRLVRALRMIAIFQDLWQIVNGVLGSLRTVASALCLCMGFAFLFACICVETITKNPRLEGDAEASEVVRTHFGSLQMTMLTVIQFSDADSIGDIYAPLIHADIWLVINFIGVFMIFTIALTNLVTAVIVEHAIECSKGDREVDCAKMRKKIKKLEPAILRMFREIDTSQDGKISINELKELRYDRRRIPRELQDIIMPDNLADLFEFLDTDGSGEVDEDEFVDGIVHLAVSGTAIQTTQILQLLRDSRTGLQNVVRTMDRDSGMAEMWARANKSRSQMSSLNSHYSFLDDQL